MADKEIYNFVDNTGDPVPLKAKVNSDGITYSFGTADTPSPLTADADITQLLTVTSSGTAVQGPNVENPGGWCMRADPNNTGNVMVMFHGQSKELKGYPLGAGTVQPLYVSNLNNLDFGASANGQKVWFMKL